MIDTKKFIEEYANNTLNSTLKELRITASKNNIPGLIKKKHKHYADSYDQRKYPVNKVINELTKRAELRIKKFETDIQDIYSPHKKQIVGLLHKAVFDEIETIIKNKSSIATKRYI